MAATLMTEAMVTAALEATASKTKPKDADPFRKGDCVVYPAHGVGRIDRVGVEEIAGHRLNLIHISFDENKNDATRTSGARRWFGTCTSAETVPAAASASAICSSLRSTVSRPSSQPSTIEAPTADLQRMI